MNISKELIIILLIALLVFGTSRISGLGSALGKAIRDFRKAVDEPESDKVHPSPPDSQPRQP